MTYLVYETDLGVYLEKNAKLENISFKAKENMISIEIDGVNKVEGKNLMLVQEVQHKCWPVVQKEAQALIKDLVKADAEKDTKKRDTQVEKLVLKFNTDVSDKLVDEAHKVFKVFAKDKKDYKYYKIKSGFKIAINGAGLAASITLTALAGWTGVGTVVGAVGMVRTASSLVQQIINLSVESDTIYKRIVGNVLKMKKQLSSPNLKTNTAKEVGKTVVNKIFAVEIETLFVTIEGIERDFTLLKNKVKGQKVNTTSMADTVQKLLQAQDLILADITKEKKKIEDLKKKNAPTAGPEKAIKKLEEALTKNEKALDVLLIKVIAIRETVNKIEEWTVTYHKDILDLKAKYNPKIVTGIGLATDFLLAAGSFIGGNFSDPASTIKDLHDGAKVVVTSLALANDSFSTIKDIGSSIYDTVTG